MTLRRGQLFEDGHAPATGERFDVLFERHGTVVERILSSAQPEPEVYDQEQDEWVALLRGEATLEVDGKSTELQAGDWLVLPARKSHRVTSTSAGALWLAVHIRPQGGTDHE